MPVLRGIGTLARCCAAGGQSALHEVGDAALVFDEDEVIWAGPEDELIAAIFEMVRMPPELPIEWIPGSAAAGR